MSKVKERIATQPDKVLRYVKDREDRSITCWDAIQYLHVTRLPEIIRRLELRGHKFKHQDCERKTEEGVVRYTRYIYTPETEAV